MNANYRQERIKRLLHELEYEVTRGIMEREVDEEIGFRFVVPLSPRVYPTRGIVACEFRTRPLEHQAYLPREFTEPERRLRLVVNNAPETSKDKG